MNTRKNEQTVNDQMTMMQIHRQGDLKRAKITDLDNEFSFEGSQNSLTMQRIYAIDFECEYYMAWYPFDLQKCTIVIGLRSRDVNYMEILPDILEYTGPSDLSQYFVKEYRMIRNSMKYMGKEQKAIIVEIILGRRLLSTILTVYTPTILLNIIGHSTNFFKDFFFEAVITVNLTVMLVLVTMFISVSNNLPTTAYVKMIDIWLIFNLTIPFVEVLLHTYMDYYRDDSDREINHHGKTIEIGEEKGKITKVLPVNVTPELGSRKADLVSRHEDIQVTALQKKYKERLENNSEKNARKVKKAEKFANICIPILVVSFVVFYWAVGLRAAYGEYKEQ